MFVTGIKKTCVVFRISLLLPNFAHNNQQRYHYMEENNNKYIAVAYKLYSVEENETELLEEATTERPFIFISHMGVTLPAFEEKLVGLSAGEEFDFTIGKDQAYGDYDDEGVLELDKEMFCIDGKFDHEHIYEDAIIPLQNQEGQRFQAQVVKVGADKVTVDLNHPLAGCDLKFVGSVLVSREATNQELEQMAKLLSGEGCGGCGGCGGGGCDNGDCEGGGCEGGGCDGCGSK